MSDEPVSPEFSAAMQRVVHVALRVRQLGALAQLDVSQAITGEGADPATGAELCRRGQAALARENAELMTELADAYDALAAYFARAAG